MSDRWDTDRPNHDTYEDPIGIGRSKRAHVQQLVGSDVGGGDLYAKKMRRPAGKTVGLFGGEQNDLKPRSFKALRFDGAAVDGASRHGPLDSTLELATLEGLAGRLLDAPTRVASRSLASTVPVTAPSRTTLPGPSTTPPNGPGGSTGGLALAVPTSVEKDRGHDQLLEMNELEAEVESAMASLGDPDDAYRYHHSYLIAVARKRAPI